MISHRTVTQLLLDPEVPAIRALTLPRQLIFGALMLGIAVTALWLRFVGLGEWGLWVDELYSVRHAAELAHGQVDIRFLAYVPHLLGFELAGVDMSRLDPKAIWTWQVAGVSEWKMRAPVVVLGAFSIMLLGLASIRTFGGRATVLLCLLLALSPWHLWMSQVGRFYIQLFLLYNLALLLYYQATEHNRLGRLLLAVALAVLAFYTTPIALMLAAIIGVDLTVSWLRRRPVPMRASFWITGAIGLAMCVAGIMYHFSESPDAYSHFSGSPQSISLMTMGHVYMVGVPMVVMALLGFWSLLPGRRRLAILLATSALMPLTVFILFNVLGKDTHVRYTFVALFPWLALAAVGMDGVISGMRICWSAPTAWLPVTALVSNFALSDYVYLTSGSGYRPPWQQALAYVKQHRHRGELIAADPEAREMSLYYTKDPAVVLLPDHLSPAEMLQSLLSPTWIVYYASRPSTGDRTQQLEAIEGLDLKAHFSNQIAQPYHAIRVYYYEPQSR